MHPACTQGEQTGGSLTELFFGSLFDLLTVLDLVNEDLRRLKARDEVFLDDQGCVSGYVPRYFSLPLFIDETPKATNINVVAIRHRILHHTEKSFYRCGHVSLIYSGLFRDFVYYICFSHFLYF